MAQLLQFIQIQFFLLFGLSSLELFIYAFNDQRWPKLVFLTATVA